jgi:hypothetical protein
MLMQTLNGNTCQLLSSGSCARLPPVALNIWLTPTSKGFCTVPHERIDLHFSSSLAPSTRTFLFGAYACVCDSCIHDLLYLCDFLRMCVRTRTYTQASRTLTFTIKCMHTNTRAAAFCKREKAPPNVMYAFVCVYIYVCMRLCVCVYIYIYIFTSINTVRIRACNASARANTVWYEAYTSLFRF